MSRTSLAVAASAFLFAASTGAAQTVSGRALESATGTPIAGASILLTSAAGHPIADLITDATGAFAIALEEPGTYALRAERMGYETVTGAIQVPGSDTLTVEILLAASAIEVEPVVVSARARTSRYLQRVGFTERYNGGTGTFLTRDDIERRHPSRITDLMYGIAGVRVLPVSRGSGLFDVRMRHTGTIDTPEGYCQPEIVLDGIVARPGGYPRGDPDDNVELTINEIVVPDHVSAIEVYPGIAQIPSRFGATGSACGVIVIWTRHAAG